jgi:hypothetical protein
MILARSQEAGVKNAANLAAKPRLPGLAQNELQNILQW